MASRQSSSASRNTLLVTLALGVALIGVAASFYATSTRNVWLADRARSLAEIDGAITTTEVAQHQLGIALLLATELDAGVTNEQTVSLAIGNARTTLAKLGAASLESGEFDAVMKSFADAAEALLLALKDNDLGAARDLVAPDLTPAYEALTTDLVTARNRLVAQIDTSRSANGIAATVSGLIVVLLVPLAMLVAYRTLARRQIRRSELETKLLAERELSRSKDEFIANISHELRTPLTSIYGFAQVLESDGLSDPTIARELLGLIVNQAGELERMVDDLLTTARVNADALSFKLDSIDLIPEVEEVIPSFERNHRPIRVSIESTPVAADPLRLRQILRNLLANARKHGGEHVELWGHSVDGRYELTVVDDGPGVPDHLLDALFERFMHAASTPLVAGSVGLGLHIARALAQGMGGNIEYQRINQRTHFVLTLDLAPTAAMSRAGQEVAVA
jgi:signal transduction histidine kinase